ncbi:hypothetical protein GCM10010123_15560 [Pilimelia anulata]|uniref:Peptidyl-Asp metalloendopeptidase n=1 Tax=Pilimelia anulata TaxID=53371 RepID=A0A8J3B2F0_9ACTN|nr:M12 family metallo-peptidase [Pilimelia anulata]GGJ86869.1 hypothetical protein GCM10010123_15560 [Pilimelia anulata]
MRANRTLLVVGIAGLVLSGTATARAADTTPPATLLDRAATAHAPHLFTPATPGPGPGFAALAADPGYRSAVPVGVDPAALAADVGTLAVDVGGRTRYVQRVRTETIGDGTAWSGVAHADRDGRATAGVDETEWFTVVRRGGQVSGTFRAGGAIHRIDPVPGGGHVLREVDPAAIPPMHPPAWPSGYTGRPAADPLRVAGRPATAAEPYVIRALVVQPSAMTGDVRSAAQKGVAQANLTYQNSGINITMELADAKTVNYREQGFQKDLDVLTRKGDGQLDEVHQMRDAARADVVVLLVSSRQYCGLAWLNASAEQAFGVVGDFCVGTTSAFEHEVGHNQGASHDPETSQTDGTGGGKPAFAYGQGFRKPGVLRTTMAYQCSRQGHPECPEVRYWSTPTKQVKGVTIGTANANDNVRLLNETAPRVSRFRN